MKKNLYKTLAAAIALTISGGSGTGCGYRS